MFIPGDCNVLVIRRSSMELAAKSVIGIVPWSEGDTSTGTFVDENDDLHNLPIA